MQAEALTYIRSHGKILDVTKFCGKWYIIRTSLNFWQRRVNPSVTYTLMEPGARTKLLDIIHYGPAGKSPKQVVGVDTQDKTNPNLFQWRGRSGLSWLFGSEWLVLDHDDACQAWAVTYFSSTPVTQAGIDIYARQPNLSSAKLAEIQAQLQANQFLASYASVLFAPMHEAQ
ncbi:MAG: lipocalin family protein [Chloroflexi bacterium]|nr:lipocalin family protein [Chloroflexota bacterium]